MDLATPDSRPAIYYEIILSHAPENGNANLQTTHKQTNQMLERMFQN